MTSARSIADFEKGTTFDLSNGEKRSIRMRRGVAAKVLEEEREKWRNRFDVPQPGWGNRSLNERLLELAGDLNDEIDCAPPLVVRLDAALRHEDEIVRLTSNANTPLNPNSEARRNDGIDHNMSYVFMKKILLCTEEKKYPKLMRGLGSFQSDWIFRPEELVEKWKSGDLKTPNWPKGGA